MFFGVRLSGRAPFYLKQKKQPPNLRELSVQQTEGWRLSFRACRGMSVYIDVFVSKCRKDDLV